MKSLLIFLLISAQLFALELVLNSGKEKNTQYAILHIKDGAPFSCEMLVDDFEKKHYLCKIDRAINKLIEPKKTKLAEISFYNKDNSFYIMIEPRVSSKLIPVVENLYETREILTKQEASSYEHWTVLLEEKPLYSTKEPHDAIDFPIDFPKNQRPSIGALDLNGAPISYAQSKDIGLYLEAKQDYEKGKYEDVIKEVKRILTNFPHSIFKSELELYQMRSIDKLISLQAESGDDVSASEQDIISIAKRWSKEFASDANLPEVLMLMTKSYIKAGSKSDLNYIIDIMISEHPESPFTKRAILLYADNLFAKKEKDKAMNLYLDVLYSVADLDIASEAAIRLSDHQMDAGKLKEAKEYLLKVLNVNANFLLKDKNASYKLAKRLYEHKLYDLSAKISDLLLENMNKKDEQKEILLKESGDWHAKAGNVEIAHDRYKEYLDSYKEGEYVQEVNESLDRLFFRLTENNETKLEMHYDKLIKNYSNEIGEKALVEKAKLLLKQKRFEDVLALKEQLEKAAGEYEPKPEEIIYEAALTLALQELEKAECHKVVNLIEEHKLQIADGKNDEKIFGCFMQLSRYERAREISANHLADKVLQSRFLWTQKELSALFKMGKYEEILAFKEDLASLSNLLKQGVSIETLRTLFFSSVRLKKREDALSLAQNISTIYPREFTNVDVYFEVVKMGNETKDDLLIISYAKKIVELQKAFKSYTHTPSVEFYYIEALKRVEKDNEALAVAEELITQKLENSDKTRAFYYAGELSLKMKDKEKAQSYFLKCSQIEENSSWKNICIENLKLF